MKKILFILLSMLLLTACSNSETPIQKQEVTMSKDEIPQETIDGITQIVIDYESHGVEVPCETCRCTIRHRESQGNGNVLYQFSCSSGNYYWASYCADTGTVLVTPMYEEFGGITLTPPPPPHCS